LRDDTQDLRSESRDKVSNPKRVTSGASARHAIVRLLLPIMTPKAEDETHVSGATY
jgi:hypothetical protein